MIEVRRGFEFFVALRYLTARRKQAVISIITVISVFGVGFGVMALIVAMAVTTGFRNTLQRNLLGATGHVWVLEKEISEGIKGWKQLTAKLGKLPGVESAAPALYGPVMYMGLQSTGGQLKGILPPSQAPVPPALRKLKAGEFKDWGEAKGFPPIILGSRLAQQTGMTVGAVLRVLSPQGELTPYGPKMAEFRFRVTGIFESGFFDLDNTYGFTSLDAAQRVMGLTSDIVNTVELTLKDVYRARELAQEAEAAAGPQYGTTHWMDQNRQLLSALEMERIVTAIVVLLIQLVAALNILISLVMMVMEKHRDIAILMSLGARKSQVSRIFMLQGTLIGIVGTALGLAAGYALCFFGERGHWIELDEAIYSLSYVPFEPKWIDGVWVAAVAIGVSFVATIIPARAATRIQPAESLRYQ